MQHHEQNQPYLIHFCIYSLYPVCFFKLLNSFFMFSKWSASAVSKCGCHKCISDMNLSPANKNLLIMLFILYNEIALNERVRN